MINYDINSKFRFFREFHFKKSISMSLKYFRYRKNVGKIFISIFIVQ